MPGRIKSEPVVVPEHPDIVMKIVDGITVDHRAQVCRHGRMRWDAAIEMGKDGDDLCIMAGLAEEIAQENVLARTRPEVVGNDLHGIPLPDRAVGDVADGMVEV